MTFTLETVVLTNVLIICLLGVAMIIAKASKRNRQGLKNENIKTTAYNSDSCHDCPIK